jgi:hypothetical protein
VLDGSVVFSKFQSTRYQVEYITAWCNPQQHVDTGNNKVRCVCFVFLFLNDRFPLCTVLKVSVDDAPCC